MDQVRQLALTAARRFPALREEAEDIAQEAVLRLTQARSNGMVIADEGAFAVRVAARLAIEWLRKRSRRPVKALEEGIAAAPTASTGARPAEVERLYAAIGRLPTRQAAVVTLRHLYQLEYGEVAAILETTETNCRSLCRHAIRRLRRLLSEG